jgi:hypothetical protein
MQVRGIIVKTHFPIPLTIIPLTLPWTRPAFNPDISFFARSANNPEPRLAAGFALAMALKADSKSALRT